MSVSLIPSIQLCCFKQKWLRCISTNYLVEGSRHREPLGLRILRLLGTCSPWWAARGGPPQEPRKDGHGVCSMDAKVCLFFSEGGSARAWTWAEKTIAVSSSLPLRSGCYVFFTNSLLQLVWIWQWAVSTSCWVMPHSRSRTSGSLM
jgi:hypothetical protein